MLERGGVLLHSRPEDPPAPLVVVHDAGELAEEVRGMIDHLRGGVEAARRGVPVGEIGAHGSGGEVDAVEQVGGALEDPRRRGSSSMRLASCWR